LILASPSQVAAASNEARQTLDELFRQAARRRPDAIALLDPLNRGSFTDGAPRRLTYAAVDAAISTIAARLREFGLSSDAIVAMQLPNTVESVVTLLAVLRAGMIAAPIPLLWRQAEMTAALGRIGARALITCRRVGQTDHGELAAHVAAETFAIRFVCGFGENLPDGVVSLDDAFETPAADAAPAFERGDHAADHVAVVTWDTTADGHVPVARSHRELISAGAAVTAEAHGSHRAVVLSALMTSSLPGLACTVVPWLFTGGTLVLHHPFAPAVLAAQRVGERCTLAVLPGALAPRLLEAGVMGGRYGLAAVIGMWRSPERLSASPNWPGGSTALIDVAAFGEIGLIAKRRAADGAPLAITMGPNGAGSAIEVGRTASGTLALRGPMVPRHAFPPGAERGDVRRLKIGDDGFVDTGYASRLDRTSNTVIIDAPPAGVVGVGGYRFALRELQDLLARVDGAGSLAALPDLLGEQRLAGIATDRAAVRGALAGLGANPLFIGAFRERRTPDASAA
jgi:acyl-CoA synthetase (AMP-forming)/AMP-acid ligase II